jgi:hypothetical protein
VAVGLRSLVTLTICYGTIQRYTAELTIIHSGVPVVLVSPLPPILPLAAQAWATSAAVEQKQKILSTPLKGSLMSMMA